MSYSFSNIIDRSKNKDRESNKNFNNNIISINSNKKKSSQEDIDDMVNKTYEKIFDVIKYKDMIYFCDKNQGLIWDSNSDLCGLVSNKGNIWFEEEDQLEKKILIENKEFKLIIENYLN